MLATLDRLDSIDLGNEFPDKVWVSKGSRGLHIARSNKSKVWGLLCFADEAIAKEHMQPLEDKPIELSQKTFDEAREMAKGLSGVDALFLIKDGVIQETHWVR